ncbi:hypothetical protein J2Y69_001238 [Microbacterium resistens]|uniref:PucR C-terminal helix-turn-helix domain-containing protein n=1 Tax=Microbacterium resistens TaxID=156977 RepID=A0ABU1SAL7_9MICO|nr:hypothetical protein [Microbacterium resistens]MDR6866645.1 hypothetical protein [Microbacterium resistens]
MQELAGRLTALDPDASESLKVISYFDALVAGGAGIDALLRAAALLSGAVVGGELDGRIARMDAGGRAVGSASSQGWSSQGWPASAAGGRRVWIEREGAAHANDAMILERLSLAVAIVDTRRPGAEPGSVEIVLDGARSADERAVAATRLRIGGGPFRVAALPLDADADADAPPGPSAVLAGPYGLARAVIAPAGAVPAVGGHAAAESIERLPEAWIDARAALRITDARHPVCCADDLGAAMQLVRAHDPSTPRHPDVDAIIALDPRARELLDELVEAESVRAAAASLGLHHSTLQSRHETLTRQLGYDPRSRQGRLRYEVARLLERLV